MGLGSRRPLRLVFFGLSISSSWGNGHATTFRGLIRELDARGHRVSFYERQAPWFAENCDLPSAPYCEIRCYEAWPPPGVEAAVGEADVVVVGSFAADGIAITDWLPRHTRAALVYYDIDTPRTLEGFREQGAAEYLRADQLATFDLVLSFAGGPVLDELRRWGARRVEPFYCAVDHEHYRPVAPAERYLADLGYMGTYDPSRQGALEELFVAPARLRPEGAFFLAGAQYPDERWPANVRRSGHVPPPEHPSFYASCAWQLKVTRAPMRLAGWSPSVTLFEAAACGAPLLSDRWAGFEDFFAPGVEALVVDTRDHVLMALDLPAARRRALGEAGRERCLRAHTYVQRVDQLLAALDALGVAGAVSLPAAERIG